MASTFDDEFLADAAPELLSHFGETVSYQRPSGTIDTITARVRHLPSRKEDRTSHRVRIDSVEVLAYDNDAGLGDVDEGAGLNVDADPSTPNYDFRDVIRRSGGLVTALFERVTILDTGTPQIADV